MLEIDPPTRRGGERFLRHANAITQAEIRRLSGSRSALSQPAHGETKTVQQELRRLGARGRGPAPRQGRRA